MKLVTIFLGLVAFTISNAIPNEEKEAKSIDDGIEQRLSQLEETVERQIAEQKDRLSVRLIPICQWRLVANHQLFEVTLDTSSEGKHKH